MASQTFCNTRLLAAISSQICPSRFVKYWAISKLPVAKFILREAGVLKDEELSSLAQVMEEMNYKDPDITKPINIGFSKPSTTTAKAKTKTRIDYQDPKFKELERTSRNRTLKVPLKDVKTDWKNSLGPVHIQAVAEHYGIYRDLFEEYAYFTPWVSLDITYQLKNDTVAPVFRGNHVKPSEASKEPDITFKSDPKSLWTLLLTNLDGNLEDQSTEYLHWMIGNIPSNEIGKGETLMDYLQPFPVRGTGYHRYAFILFKQDKVIDFSSYKKAKPCLSLSERNFKTDEFYRRFQDVITPCGLAFFQSDWDESVKNVFHNKLNMKEPVFAYEHPVPYHPPQKCHPHSEPFNLYLDKYRDPKDIKREIFLKRLKCIHPFKPEPPRPRFPNAYFKPQNMSSWQKLELTKERLRMSKYREMDCVDIFPGEK